MALPPVRDFVGGRIMLGYNIGLDLAVLSAEAKRHGPELHWLEALCLRQVSALLIGRDSSLMVADLEGLAMHFEGPTKPFKLRQSASSARKCRHTDWPSASRL